ncbi:hypothetical protein BKA67DRAFT_534529 [Truncatella angustata]|uniref:Uncharacterized protein n=1 Tax=Truncatella angustata TaxID=152316 RepID=A0A9P8ZZ20_9PEZI|nr:uncharacterized protein BKA67DRAFT_534529 [Truncatella angustata]KAH6655613.1 hypothetical protein BKA67DRAFT_534529 [Truncatella angustata]KAH8197804.1 hypothetical protein TruAng_008051 [Truncatella angustata]
MIRTFRAEVADNGSTAGQTDIRAHAIAVKKEKQGQRGEPKTCSRELRTTMRVDGPQTQTLENKTRSITKKLGACQKEKTQSEAELHQSRTEMQTKMDILQAQTTRVRHKTQGVAAFIFEANRELQTQLKSEPKL